MDVLVLESLLKGGRKEDVGLRRGRVSNWAFSGLEKALRTSLLWP